MCEGLRVKYTSFLSDFNETWIFSTDFRTILKCQVPWQSVPWEQSCSMRTDRRTDRCVDAHSRFSQFCERASNSLIHSSPNSQIIPEVRKPRQHNSSWESDSISSGQQLPCLHRNGMILALVITASHWYVLSVSPIQSRSSRNVKKIVIISSRRRRSLPNVIIIIISIIIYCNWWGPGVA
jgi:hypothetical protein